MKKLLSISAYKLIFWICFIPALIYILMYELVFTNFPSVSNTVYKLGVIASRISYSILAASIFYFISQYIPVHLPRQKRKIKILPYIFQQTMIIDYNLSRLRNNLGIQHDDFIKSEKFNKILDSINPAEPIDEFDNWVLFLSHLRIQILEVIRSIYFYSEYLNLEYLHEIIIIEKYLMSPITFPGHKASFYSNLSYASITIQELLIHNQHLQAQREIESKKYSKAIEADGEIYRQIYYHENKKQRRDHNKFTK